MWRRGLLVAALAAALLAPMTTVVLSSQQQSSMRELVSALTCEIVAPPETDVISDCGCSFDTVDAATRSYFGPILAALTKTTFFRYFKVDLDRPCPFWADNAQCMRRECAIQECAAGEVPTAWAEEDRERRAWAAAQHDDDDDGFPFGPPCDTADANNWVDRSGAVMPWSETGGDEVWSADGESASMVYVDLVANPEKFTGYSGEPAARIWRAIHDENCFVDPPKPRELVLEAFRRIDDDPHGDASSPGGECFERRVFHRLVSGLQASISTHIARSDFSARDVLFKFTAPKDRPATALNLLTDRLFFGTRLADQAKNDPVFVERVGRHKERLHNLYFCYLFVLRAVSKARHELKTYDYFTGSNEAHELNATRRLVAALVDRSESGFSGEAASDTERFDAAPPTSCPRAADDARAAFDDSALFKPPEYAGMTPLERALARESVEALRGEFLARFRNISRIMDCVTCERCRLWGKLQVLGLGTALKILLMEGDDAGVGVLQRNEVVALVNTLGQLAKSVDSVQEWKERDRVFAAVRVGVFVSVVLVGGVVAVLLALRLARGLRRLVRSFSRSGTPTPGAAVKATSAAGSDTELHHGGWDTEEKDETKNKGGAKSRAPR